MTRKIALSIIVCLTVTGLTSKIRAEESEVYDGERNPPVVNLQHGAIELALNTLALPLYFTWQTAEHEYSHAARVTYYGLHVTDIVVMPSLVRDNQGQRFLRLGYTSWTGRPLTYWEDANTLVAPYVTNMTEFALADQALTNWVDPRSPLALPVLIGWMVMPMVNVYMNFSGGASSLNDISRVAKITNTPRRAWQLGADALVLIGAWRVYTHGREILFGGYGPYRRHQKSKGLDVALIPMSSAGQPLPVLGVNLVGVY